MERESYNPAVLELIARKESFHANPALVAGHPDSDHLVARPFALICSRIAWRGLSWPSVSSRVSFGRAGLPRIIRCLRPAVHPPPWCTAERVHRRQVSTPPTAGRFHSLGSGSASRHDGRATKFFGDRAGDDVDETSAADGSIQWERALEAMADAANSIRPHLATQAGEKPCRFALSRVEIPYRRSGRPRLRGGPDAQAPSPDHEARASPKGALTGRRFDVALCYGTFVTHLT